jgi:hypothetical protein
MLFAALCENYLAPFLFALFSLNCFERPMKFIPVLILCAGALTANAAQAQASAPAPAVPAAASVPAALDPATDKAVRELLAAMKYRDQLNAAFTSMQKNIPTMILQMATAPINANTALTDVERKAALDRATKGVPDAVAGVTAIVSDPKLIDEMITEIVPLYARHFTVTELKAMTVFYKSPAGAKMLQTMPRVMNESMQISQKLLMPRIQKYVDKVAAAPK